MPYFAIRCEYAASESRRKTHETCVRASCLSREAETVVDRAAGPARPASPTLSKHCGSTVAGGGAQATARAVSNVDLRPSFTPHSCVLLPVGSTTGCRRAKGAPRRRHHLEMLQRASRRRDRLTPLHRWLAK